MKTNVAARETTRGFTTHEGAPAVELGAIAELEKTVACCMLFENTFYESGSDIAKRIEALCEQVSPADLTLLAIRARGELKLRHVSLFLCIQLLKKKSKHSLVGICIEKVIQRADELAEILAMYWKDGRKPLPRQLKVGIAKAFRKFNAYQLAKYNRDGKVKLRDALFLSHAKPKDDEQAATWKRLIDGTLEAPDTWEVALSAGKDKGETFTRLIQEKKLGYMALLRNLRNMEEAGVDHELVRSALITQSKGSKALPYRFVAAAKHAPSYAQDVSDAMLASLEDYPNLEGRTAIVVDTSGSMECELSGKSKMNRIDAATSLAILLREISNCRVFVFGTHMAEVKNLRGMALMDAIGIGDVGHGTNIGNAILGCLSAFPDIQRMFVITDEQSHDEIPSFDGKGYIINVAPYKPALPTKGGSWTRISGFSERIIDWVRVEEKNE